MLHERALKTAHDSDLDISTVHCKSSCERRFKVVSTFVKKKQANEAPDTLWIVLKETKNPDHLIPSVSTVKMTTILYVFLD